VDADMTATIQATGLTAGHGARVLFSDLDLIVAPGDVVGLVGANGAGKSTLLRLLAGEQDPEDGKIVISPPDATVGHLPQEPERRPGETVAAFIARRRRSAAAPRVRTTRTQLPWTAGSPSAGPTWRSGPGRSRPRSGSAWISTRR
jgi:ATPase subunit of ABC transporter with duplicated ATPase domains